MAPPTAYLRAHNLKFGGSNPEYTAATLICPSLRNTWIDTSLPCRRSIKSTADWPRRRLRSVTSSRNGGSRGLRSRISLRSGSNSRPSEDCKSISGVPAAQACGEQATG